MSSQFSHLNLFPISLQKLAIFQAQTTSIPPKPPLNLTFQCVQTTSIPPYSLHQASSCSCNQTLQYLPTKVNPILNEELLQILNQSKTENQVRREKEKLERQKERETDLENFKIEKQRDLEKFKFGCALPP